MAFQIDKEGTRRYLKSTEMQRTMLAVGNDIATRARGNGANTITVEVTPNGGVKRDRAEVVITNTDPDAAAVEFGNRRTQATRPLRRALGA